MTDGADGGTQATAEPEADGSRPRGRTVGWIAAATAIVGALGVVYLMGSGVDESTAVRFDGPGSVPGENFQIIVPALDDGWEIPFVEDPRRTSIAGGVEGSGASRRLSTRLVRESADAGAGFAAYWAGPTVAGLPLTGVSRSHFVDELPGVADPPVEDKFFLSYGTCELTGGRESSCFLPLQIAVIGSRCPAGALDDPMISPSTPVAPIRRFRVRGIDVEQFRSDDPGVVAYVGRQAIVVNFADASAVATVLAGFGIAGTGRRRIDAATAGRAVVEELRGIGRRTGHVRRGDDLPARPAGVGTFTAGKCPKSRSSLRDQPFAHGPEWRVPPPS